MTDRRRGVPRTDRVLADPALRSRTERLGREVVKSAVHAAQDRCRSGQVEPGDVAADALRALPRAAGSMRSVLNATGILLHTNLGRAPLSPAAIAAVVDAAGTTDVELDLASGRRSGRGRSAMAALAAAVPAAGAVHVVNNNAAVLVLAATALAAGREIVVSRGELVEIGAGFRLPDLLASTGARLVEVGTTNRTTACDYAAAIGPDTGFLLKVHPSNFVVTGFTAAPTVHELAGLEAPLVVDIGSGLLSPQVVLPDEPDAATVLAEGADLVTASGDKLLGGPQAGLILGRSDLVDRLKRHPLARALRVDKLTLAALEATLVGPPTPTALALQAPRSLIRYRAEELAEHLRGVGIAVDVLDTDAAVGGGGAPGVALPSAAVALSPDFADRLRLGPTSVLGRVAAGRLLLDLRAVPPGQDAELAAAVVAVAAPAPPPPPVPASSPRPPAASPRR